MLQTELRRAASSIREQASRRLNPFWRRAWAPAAALAGKLGRVPTGESGEAVQLQPTGQRKHRTLSEEDSDAFEEHYFECARQETHPASWVRER
jgi:hypothetical protein